MSRTPSEWIGKTDDSKPPPRVRIRVFERYGGICHISGRKIQAGEKWELDHIQALINGGENRESNLAPVLVAPHKEKTKRDVAIKKKTARIKAKHLGQYNSRSAFGNSRYSKKFDGTVVDRATGEPVRLR